MKKQFGYCNLFITDGVYNMVNESIFFGHMEVIGTIGIQEKGNQRS